MKALILFLFTLLLSSCGGGGDQKETPPNGNTPEEVLFSIAFSSIRDYSDTQSFSVTGQATKPFGAINFSLASSCDQEVLASVTQSQLRVGVTFPVPVDNETVNIYYSLTEVPSYGCRLLSTFTHDTVAPSAPTLTLPSIQELDGLRTRHDTVQVEIDFDSLPEDVYGFRFYGNFSKTQFLGEVTPDNTDVSLAVNAVTTFYYSHIDRAGNESLLYNTDVFVTNDSVPPAIPVTHLSGTQYSPVSTFGMNLVLSSDTVGVAVYAPTGRHVFLGVTSVDLELASNQENNFEIRAIDDVGNESLPLKIDVVHDNIVPSRPTLSAESLDKLNSPVQGPTNSFTFTASEIGLIRLIGNNEDEYIFPVVTGSNSINIAFNPADGVNNFTAYLVDRAGNASLPLTFNLLADSTAPNIFTPSGELLAHDNGHLNTDFLRITGNSHDAVTVLISSNLGSSTHHVSELSPGIDVEMEHNQVNTIQVRLIDLAGNVSAPYVISLTHDNIAPVITLIYPEDGKSIREGGVVRGVCEQETVYASINGVPHLAPCTLGEFTVGLEQSLLDGTQIIASFSETDLAGNTATAQVNFSIDNTPPVLTVSPEFLVGMTNNPNFVISGDCEVGGTVYLTGDSNSVSSCLMGSYALSLNNTVEGMRDFILTLTDYAGNSSVVNFSKGFDFTPPPPVVLDVTSTRLHQTALQDTLIQIKGTLAEDVDVIVTRDAGFTDVVVQKTASELVVGFDVPLLQDRDNPLYIFAQDPAGNRSPLSFIMIYQRNTLSRKYLIQSQGVSHERTLGEGVQYNFTFTMKNISFDTNINKRVALEPYTFVTSTNSIVVNNALSTCDGTTIYGSGECTFYIAVNLTGGAPTTTVHNEHLRLTFQDGLTQDIPLNFISAPVTPNLITANGASKALFFSETGVEGWQRDVLEYNDIYLHQNLNFTSTDKDKRFQAKSTSKIYTICEDLSGRVCVSSYLTPNMPETYFSSVSVALPLLTQNFTSDGLSIMIQVLAEDAERDYIYIGHRLPTASTAMHSYVVSYHRDTKTFNTFTLTPTSARPALINPITGWYPIVNNKILLPLATGPASSGVYSLDLTTGILELITPSAVQSGTFILGDSLYFSSATGGVSKINMTTFNIDDVFFGSIALEDYYVCGKGFYSNEGVRNIDDFINYARQSAHALVPLCQIAGNAVTHIVYVSSADDNFTVYQGADTRIHSLQVIDNNRFIATIKTGEQTRYYYRNKLSSVNSVRDETTTGVGYHPRAYFVKGRIMAQFGRRIYELDETLDDLEILLDLNYDFFAFKATGTLGVISKDSGTASIQYYDEHFNQFNSYHPMSYYTGRTGYTIFNGFIYFYGSGVGQVGRLPLFFK